MSSNIINHIMRNNISKPNMISKTTHAVMNMGKSTHMPMVSSKEDSENLGPIRHFKTLEKKMFAEKAAVQAKIRKEALVASKEKFSANRQQIDKQDAIEREAKHQTARPQQNASSRFLQAVMGLSDKSVNSLKYLSKRNIDMGIQPTNIKTYRKGGSSILSSSSSRYSRRYRNRLHAQMFHNTIHAFSTQSHKKVSSIKEPPRNQQMNTSWAINGMDMDMGKVALSKALLPVNKNVKNLISVSSGEYPVKERDSMYNWDHPPSPDGFEFDLPNIIETVQHKRELKDGRIRLLQKHSFWENHEKVMQKLDSTETIARNLRGVKTNLQTDDPNCILNKPCQKDLTILTGLRGREESDASINKFEGIEAIRKARRQGFATAIAPTNAKDFPYQMTEKRERLLPKPKWEPSIRYIHDFGMAGKEM